MREETKNGECSCRRTAAASSRKYATECLIQCVMIRLMLWSHLRSPITRASREGKSRDENGQWVSRALNAQTNCNHRYGKIYNLNKDWQRKQSSKKHNATGDQQMRSERPSRWEANKWKTNDDDQRKPHSTVYILDQQEQKENANHLVDSGCLVRTQWWKIKGLATAKSQCPCRPVVWENHLFHAWYDQRSRPKRKWKIRPLSNNTLTTLNSNLLAANEK